MLKAVLCDIDGTLVDSNHLHGEAWQRTFEHFGIHVTLDQAIHQIGKGGDQVIPTFVPKEDVERLEKPLKEYRSDLFHREYFSQIKPFPGARELLVKIKDSGLRISIATSADKDDLAKLEGIANITDLIEKEASSADAEQSKPEPDIFQAALSKLGIKPDEAIALGDTPWDIQAAQKAGIPTIAVTSGGWTVDELRDAGALEIYSSVEDLAEKFAESALAVRQAATAPAA